METIQELLKRRYENAKQAVKNAHIAKERAIAKADSDIAAATAERDAIDDLQGLDWVKYAQLTLHHAGFTVEKKIREE